MNEQLQKALGELLDKSLNAVDFMVSELPEVVQQFLIWKMWESLIWFIFGIFILSAIIIVNKKTWPKVWKLTCEHEAPVFLANVFLSVFAFLFALIECFNITWLQILIAPTVYLIEYATSLSK